MNLIAALVSGIVFGIGLIVSGMANPAKVQNFLDIAGTWDPSLALVMGGAIAVTLPGFMFLRRRAKPVLSDAFHFPTASDIDRPLLAGAAIFGIGWGLGGFCPGPALTALPMGNSGTVFFVVSMLVGMWLARWFRRRSTDSADLADSISVRASA